MLIQDHWRDRRLALMATGCCVLGAVVGGERTAVALLPAIAAGGLRLMRRPV
jgi:hypothetical protein